MRLRRLFILTSALLLSLSLGAAVHAKTGGLFSDVYVTTQDFVSLRNGPSMAFDRIRVVDPEVTLRAIGRTATANWVQVEHEHKHGWIAARFLVWSGDLMSLPVDGVDPMPFVRRALVIAVTTRETRIYRREVVARDQVGTLPKGTQVELTGRLGRDSVQFEYQGQLYWAGLWDFTLMRGSRFSLLPDTIYLFPYGRLRTQIQAEADRSSGSLRAITSIWRRLSAGQGVSCDNLPKEAGTRRFSEADLNLEPVFIPAARALDAAISHTNAAIQHFRDACARKGDERFITDEDIQAALQEINGANRNFNLMYALLNSLTARDPILARGAKFNQP
jgi:uncharacterized protein YraI